MWLKSQEKRVRYFSLVYSIVFSVSVFVPFVFKNRTNRNFSPFHFSLGAIKKTEFGRPALQTHKLQV